MVDKIKFKRTKTAGVVPAIDSIDEGEIQLNLKDKKIFSKSGNEIVEFGGGIPSVTGWGVTDTKDIWLGSTYAFGGAGVFMNGFLYQSSYKYNLYYFLPDFTNRKSVVVSFSGVNLGDAGGKGGGSITTKDDASGQMKHMFATVFTSTSELCINEVEVPIAIPSSNRVNGKMLRQHKMPYVDLFDTVIAATGSKIYKLKNTTTTSATVEVLNYSDFSKIKEYTIDMTGVVDSGFDPDVSTYKPQFNVFGSGKYLALQVNKTNNIRIYNAEDGTTVTNLNYLFPDTYYDGYYCDGLDRIYIPKEDKNFNIVSYQGYSEISTNEGEFVATVNGQSGIVQLKPSDIGAVDEGSSTVRIGLGAGGTCQFYNSIAIGENAGYINQGGGPSKYASIAIGVCAGHTDQNNNAISIGSCSGVTGQGLYSVAIGDLAGSMSQRDRSVAIGSASGERCQQGYAVSVGFLTGRTCQQSNAVALGACAGATNQGAFSVSVGSAAGNTLQGACAIAIGYRAGYKSQAANTTAIGTCATSTYTNSVAIGACASTTSINQIQLGSPETKVATYGIATMSDCRDMADAKDLQIGLDFINRLKPITHTVCQRNGTKGTRLHTAITAQDIKAALDIEGIDLGMYMNHMVKGGDDVQSISYEELIPVMIKAIQDLSAKIDK